MPYPLGNGDAPWPSVSMKVLSNITAWCDESTTSTSPWHMRQWFYFFSQLWQSSLIAYPKLGVATHKWVAEDLQVGRAVPLRNEEI